MSWMAKLYDTYETGMGLDLPDEHKLMPISHTLQNAHINIVIDSDGCFKRAAVLEKTQVVLPATEKSAGRAGKLPPPHPLADKIQYVAKDYSDYGGKKSVFLRTMKNSLMHGVLQNKVIQKPLQFINILKKVKWWRTLLPQKYYTPMKTIN